jgi:hypothetical protein
MEDRTAVYVVCAFSWFSERRQYASSIKRLKGRLFYLLREIEENKHDCSSWKGLEML